MNNLITLNNVKKNIVETGQQIGILRDVSLEIREGECIIIWGTSGSGKSTLLNILGTLEALSSGSYIYKGMPIEKYSEDALAKIRQKDIGFIFQFYHLLPEFTVLENILLKAELANIRPKEAQKRALHLLEQIGMIHKRDAVVTTLSGGEKQRVSIARALITNPVLLLADEPTGSLDEANGVVIMELLTNLQKEFKTAIVMVTHNKDLVLPNARFLVLNNGELQSEIFAS